MEIHEKRVNRPSGPGQIEEHEKPDNSPPSSTSQPRAPMNVDPSRRMPLLQNNEMVFLKTIVRRAAEY